MTKKMRFEVFKRDGFTCGYCGRRPPEVTLEVDHITPACQGGKDRISNLLTSCFDCNRGKAGTPIDAQTHQEAAAVLKEKRDQLRAYNGLVESIEAEQEQQVDKVQSRLCEPGWIFKPRYRTSIKYFIGKLGLVKVLEAADMAADQPDNFRYLCGICWNWIKGRKPRRYTTHG